MLRISLVASLLLLAGCEPLPQPPVPPPPTPVPEAEIERAVRLRTAEQARAVEQGLANHRAESSAAQPAAEIQRRLQAEIDRRAISNRSEPPTR